MVLFGNNKMEFETGFGLRCFFRSDNRFLLDPDIFMPGLNGYELTAEIRRLEKQNGLKRIPIIALTANAAKEEEGRCIVAGMDGYLSKPVDLALLKPLIQRCRLLITNDTGPRHYAVAFDVPVIVIMGPTDPRYTHANLEKTIVLRKELACSPCHHKDCSQDHGCMTEISPETVLQAGEQLLQEHP